MLIKDGELLFRSIDLNVIDKSFIKISYHFYKTYPFKWDNILEKIIFIPSIVYFRDSTAIINVDKISFHDLESLFNLIKAYVKKEVVEKIIYKKEFIILHFNKQFHIELISNPAYLVSIPLYINLHRLYNKKCELYYNKKTENGPKFLIYLKYKNNIFLFSSDIDNNFFSEQFLIVYFFKTRRKLESCINYSTIKILFDENKLVEQIKKVVEV